MQPGKWKSDVSDHIFSFLLKNPVPLDRLLKLHIETRYHSLLLLSTSEVSGLSRELGCTQTLWESPLRLMEQGPGTERHTMPSGYPAKISHSALYKFKFTHLRYWLWPNNPKLWQKQHGRYFNFPIQDSASLSLSTLAICNIID